MKTYTFCKLENKEKVRELGRSLDIPVEFPNTSDNQVRVVAEGDMHQIGKFDMKLYEIENGTKHPSVIAQEQKDAEVKQKEPWWKKLFGM